MIQYNILNLMFQLYVSVKLHRWDHFYYQLVQKERFSLPNSRIMVHQPSAGFQGQVTDIEIHANEVLSLKKDLMKFTLNIQGNLLKKLKQH